LIFEESALYLQTAKCQNGLQKTKQKKKLLWIQSDVKKTFDVPNIQEAKRP
jgi:hypothetical protein